MGKFQDEEKRPSIIFIMVYDHAALDIWAYEDRP